MANAESSNHAWRGVEFYVAEVARLEARWQRGVDRDRGIAAILVGSISIAVGVLAAREPTADWSAIAVWLLGLGAAGCGIAVLWPRKNIPALDINKIRSELMKGSNAGEQALVESSLAILDTHAENLKESIDGRATAQLLIRIGFVLAGLAVAVTPAVAILDRVCDSQ